MACERRRAAVVGGASRGRWEQALPHGGQARTGIFDGVALYGCMYGSSMIDALSIDTNGQVVVQSGDLIFGSSGSGIVLGNTSNADANTLDDYEEGTFTPAVNGGTTNTQSFDTNGRYTKIGRQVYCQFLLFLAFYFWQLH